MTSTTGGRQVIWAFVEHEHREILAGIDRMHEVADDLATIPADRKSASVGKVLQWIEDSLKPHMVWEESWLCPQVDDQGEAAWVARLVGFDHRQILRQADRIKTHQGHLDHGPSSRDRDRDARRPARS